MKIEKLKFWLGNWQGMKIYIFVEGGLGNQLFQASYGKYLEARYDSEIVFLSITKSYRVPRECELDRFGIKVTQLSYLQGWLARFVIALLRRGAEFWPFRGLLLCEDKILDPTNVPAKKPVVVLGYWQKHQAAAVGISYLKLVYENSKIKPCGFDDVMPQKRIAVHVRCGDYRNDLVTSKRHLVCTKKYYMDSWSFMQNIMPGSVLEVFSDDVDWVKENIPFDGNVRYVAGTNSPAWVDLFKMADCDGYIISNSSFSWWAATLGDSGGKVVIAPDQWFSGVNTKDIGIVPKHWHLLPTE